MEIDERMGYWQRREVAAQRAGLTAEAKMSAEVWGLLWEVRRERHDGLRAAD